MSRLPILAVPIVFGVLKLPLLPVPTNRDDPKNKQNKQDKQNIRKKQNEKERFPMQQPVVEDILPPPEYIEKIIREREEKKRRENGESEIDRGVFILQL